MSVWGRVNATQKNLLECAAGLKKLTLDEFVARSALEAARRAIEGTSTSLATAKLSSKR